MDMTPWISSRSVSSTKTSRYQRLPSALDVGNAQVNHILHLTFEIYPQTDRDPVGRHMARESVWIAIVSILATLDISKAKDEGGRDIDPVDDQVSGIVS